MELMAVLVPPALLRSQCIGIHAAFPGKQERNQ